MRQKRFPTTRCGEIELHNGHQGVEANGGDHAQIDAKSQRFDGPEELKIQQEKGKFCEEHNYWGEDHTKVTRLGACISFR